MVNNNQHNLSEQLQLLHELQYSDLDMPYQAAKIHSNRQSRHLVANRDVRLLDTIAIALTTGNPGDVFAAAFDKRQNIQLVLAKNGPPTQEDVTAANELISLIGSPSVADAIPSWSVGAEQISISGFTICTPLSEIQSFTTTSCWQCRHTYLRLIFESSSPVRTNFLGIMGMCCRRLLPFGEILLEWSPTGPYKG